MSDVLRSKMLQLFRLESVYILYILFRITGKMKTRIRGGKNARKHKASNRRNPNQDLRRKLKNERLINLICLSVSNSSFHAVREI